MAACEADGNVKGSSRNARLDPAGVGLPP